MSAAKYTKTLSLTMIVKDGLDDLQRLQPLVEPYIDEWVVVFPPNDPAIEWATANGIKTIVEDFTQPIDDAMRSRMAVLGVEVEKGYRLFNFAAARNRALQEASGDYVLWLDADDTPIKLDTVATDLEANPDVIDANYDYYRDEEGNSISDHIRERVVKNNGKWEWKGGALGLIHETLLPKDETFLPARMDASEFSVQHNTDHVEASSLRNHAALLYEYLETKGKDPRTTYYLGTEYFNRGQYELCIQILREYVKVSGWDEEKYHAYLKIGHAYKMMGDHYSARNAYLAALDEKPEYPHAYLYLGESYHDEEQWAKSIEYILTGMQKKLPQTKYVIDKTALTFRPCVYMALNYLQLGKPDLATEWYVKAAKLNPTHPWIEENVGLFRDAKDLNDYVKAFVTLGQISQRLYPQTLPKLAEVIPDSLIDQEILMDFKWRYTKPKMWPKNSIVYFCSSAFEEWGPESLVTGTGGSEEAVIQLTKRWAKLGWDVTVYNNCKREGTVDGVHWVRYEKFNPRDMFNVLVSWRNNVFSERDIAARHKIIDMHDVPTPAVFYTAEQTEGTKLFVKSQYHQSLFPGVPADRFVIIPNGIELKTLENNGETRVKNNLVWTSSYDRGLESLLNMWPDIKKVVPDVTLDVYYGFHLYDTSPWGRTPKGQEWKRHMERLLAQDGVYDHGRVGSAEVAEAYKKADVWAYPTTFPEIDCITATKAMAAGAVPITTDFAVLPERNQGFFANQENFSKQLIDLLKNDKLKQETRDKIDIADFDWGVVAAKWLEEITQ